MCAEASAALLSNRFVWRSYEDCQKPKSVERIMLTSSDDLTGISRMVWPNFMRLSGCADSSATIAYLL
jgi:hypothetical protein